MLARTTRPIRARAAIAIALLALSSAGCGVEHINPVGGGAHAGGAGGEGVGGALAGGAGGTGGEGVGGALAGGAGGTGGAGGAGGAGGGQQVAQVPDFSLMDVNPASARYDQPVSPRDYLMRVSAWYFGHAT
ncbi:MAG: hypothetical protein IT372_32595 [Polyangiaceae bacterium]|nr:hypothetical protein [Polyangiaceae bacterium]